MIDSTNPRILADNIRHLSGESESQASDISALQEAVVALGTYSTDAVDTGMRDPDNNPIYRKIIKIPNLPNATTISVPHGIVGLKDVYNLTLIMQEVIAHDGCPIPYSTAYLIRYNSTNVIIQASGDISDRPGILTIVFTISEPGRTYRFINGSLEDPDVEITEVKASNKKK